jgi:hypothetical protein
MQDKEYNQQVTYHATHPRVSLPERLIEVDTWTQFSRHFVHAADATGLQPAFLPHFYASLLAHACNFGVEQMAHVTYLAYDHLIHWPG